MSIREEYDFKKMEGKKNPHKVGEKCECGHQVHYTSGCNNAYCGSCGLPKKPIEPKPKLPERFGLSEMNDADYQIMKTINELIEYLRGRE